MAKPYIRRKIEKPNPVPVGARFGRYLVISDGWEQVGVTGYCSDMVEARCDCGSVKFVRPSSLARGHVRSCGCLQREVAAETVKARATHGESRKGGRTPEYSVFRAMFTRCYNKNTARYPLYGGRGIKVCERWQGSQGFAAFLSDMGRRPEGASIDRIDVNGPYSPENCKWATAQEQANNRRTNRYFKINGRRQTLTQWARETGLSAATIWDRLARGWEPSKAILTPVE